MGTRITAVVIAALLATAAACGGSSGGAAQPAGSYKVIMTEFKFNPSSISVKPGTTTFFLVNQGTVAHDMIIETPSGQRLAGSDLVQAGGETTFTVDNLAAGTYPFICDQPGHEAAGMKGTLSVG
jgi:nitrite reductase (NO-forming)